MKRATKDFYVGLGMLAGAFLGWFIVIPIGIDLPASVEFRALSPDFWPHVVMILLAICGTIVAVQAHFERLNTSNRADGIGEELEGGGQVDFGVGVSVLRVFGALVGVFSMYFLIPHIGIVVAGILIILVSTFTLGERRLKYTVPLAVGLPVVLYLFFVHVANIPMPLGVFEAFR